jgi:hypothetical protein
MDVSGISILSHILTKIKLHITTQVNLIKHDKLFHNHPFATHSEDQVPYFFTFTSQPFALWHGDPDMLWQTSQLTLTLPILERHAMQYNWLNTKYNNSSTHCMVWKKN